MMFAVSVTGARHMTEAFFKKLNQHTKAQESFSYSTLTRVLKFKHRRYLIFLVDKKCKNEFTDL